MFDEDLKHANQLVEQQQLKDSKEGECRMEDIAMSW
jgi:hypothetical protein